MPAPSASLCAREHPPPRPFSMRSSRPRFGCFLSCLCHPSFLLSPHHPSQDPGLRLSGPLRAAVGSEGVSLLHSGQAIAAPRFPGHRALTSAVFSSSPQALICAQPYLGVIFAQRGGSPSRAGKETFFLPSIPGLCVSIHFSMVIANNLNRFGKAAPRRPVRLHFSSLLDPL